MNVPDLLSKTALEQASLIRTGALSSEELTRVYLARIEQKNPELNAFVTVFPERALRAARAKDRQTKQGGKLPPFHGVPMGIKDLNLVRWSLTRFGTRGVPPLMVPFDDPNVASLRRAGFVMMGKTATSELGAVPVTEPDVHPPTRNPWNPAYTPGGSSGGAGSAVSGGLLPIAQGSDGGGSIRIPSAFSHLYGIKPSRGRIPNAYFRPDQELIYSSGPLARTVEDAAAMVDVMAGLDIGKPHWAPPPPKPYLELCAEKPRPLRIRFSTQMPLGPTHPEIAAATEKAARLLSELGHQVEEHPFLSGTIEEFLPLWQHLMSNSPILFWSRAQPVTRWLCEAGKKLKEADIVAMRRTIAARALAEFGDIDLWVTPTVARPPPRVGEFNALSPRDFFYAVAPIGAFTAPFNVTGQPAASLPLGLTSEGLPMGLQLAGKPLADDLVFMVSRQLQEAMPWKSRQAPGFA